jgi:hypothetical protein
MMTTYDDRMQQRERGVLSREDFRHLPPRITPEQTIPLQPVVHVLYDPRDCSESEWRVRHGGAG